MCMGPTRGVLLLSCACGQKLAGGVQFDALGHYVEIPAAGDQQAPYIWGLITRLDNFIQTGFK